MSNFVPILVGLLITVWSPFVSAQSAGDSWSLTELTLRSVPVIWMRDGGDFVREIAPDGKSFIELQGRLQMPAGARLDPIALAEIRLRPADSTQGASAQSAAPRATGHGDGPPLRAVRNLGTSARGGVRPTELGRVCG